MTWFTETVTDPARLIGALVGCMMHGHEPAVLVKDNRQVCARCGAEYPPERPDL